MLLKSSFRSSVSWFRFNLQVDYESADPVFPQHLSSKRKTRQQREAEMTLQLLEPEMPSEAAIR